jgi:hypothetical protein
MKNRNEVRFPTSAELYALEREAHRLRAQEVARLLKAAAVAIRSFFSVSTKEIKHA